MALRRRRTAFVLSGGGNLGALQVGMLRALAEAGIVPDVVVGCSVGSLNGAAFAGAPTVAGVRRLEDHWRTTTSFTIMPASRIPPAVNLVRKGESIHSSDGLRQNLQEILGGYRTFEDLALPFHCVATDVEAANGAWFSEGELLPAVLASAALPAVYPPVTIDGRRYIDGGVVDNVPIGRAVELGCTTVYVLHVGPHGRPDVEIRRPLDAALLAYWIARNHRFARDLATLPAGVEAVVLPTGVRPDIRYDDFSQTPELVAQGYALTSTFLAERALAAPPRRRTAERLEPLQRLVVSARARRRRQLAQAAVDGTAGAVITGEDGSFEADPD
ncbi:MAG: patatin-like phospholipase family protein [Actinomycetes bacterium]